MSIKTLKEQHTELNTSILDMLREFDPSKTGRYLPFLIRILKAKKNGIKEELIIDRIFNEIKDTIKYEIGEENIDILERFDKHFTQKRIVNKDLTKYTSFDQISHEVMLADIKQQNKKLEKETIICFKDEQFLLLKPLSFESSRCYGSGTKWCTTMEDDKTYFYNYSKDGILLYLIDYKNPSNKWGIHKNLKDEEVSYWDILDKRKDSRQTKLPSYILDEIDKVLDEKSSNYQFFTHEVIKQEPRGSRIGRLPIFGGLTEL